MFLQFDRKSPDLIRWILSFQPLKINVWSVNSRNRFHTKSSMHLRWTRKMLDFNKSELEFRILPNVETWRYECRKLSGLNNYEFKLLAWIVKSVHGSNTTIIVCIEQKTRRMQNKESLFLKYKLMKMGWGKNEKKKITILLDGVEFNEFPWTKWLEGH